MADLDSQIYLSRDEIRNQIISYMQEYLELENVDLTNSSFLSFIVNIISSEVIAQNCIYTLEGHRDWVESVAFSPDGKLLASGSWDNTIKIWDVETWHCVQTLVGHQSGIESVSFSNDGKLLASGSRDNTVKIWDTSKWVCIHSLSGHSDWINSVAFSLDGKLLASGSDDGTVKLWEVSSGYCIRTLKGYARDVYSVTFSPDGNLLASGSGKNGVNIWDIETGMCLITLKGHNDRVSSISFSHDGSLIASGSWDKRIRIWRSSRAALASRLTGNVLLSSNIEKEKRSVQDTNELLLTLPPELVIDGVILNEPSHKNAIDANETGSIEVKIYNKGRGLAKDVEIKLTSLTSVHGLSFETSYNLGDMN